MRRLAERLILLAPVLAALLAGVSGSIPGPR